MTHVCVGNLTIIGSDNGLSPGRRQAIIWTSAGILLFWTLGNKLQWNFNRNSNIFIHENAFENVVCEMASILSRLQCVKKLCYNYKQFSIFPRNPSDDISVNMWNLWGKPFSKAKKSHCMCPRNCTVGRRMHDDVITWKRYLHYWPSVRGIHRVINLISVINLSLKQLKKTCVVIYKLI